MGTFGGDTHSFLSGWQQGQKSQPQIFFGQKMHLDLTTSFYSKKAQPKSQIGKKNFFLLFYDNVLFALP